MIFEKRIFFASLIALLIVLGAGLYFRLISKIPTTGNIEGSLGYPAETIPAGMKICAEEVSTN